MLEKNQLVLKLITNGGTFKNINKKGQKILPSIDLDGITQYLLERSRFNSSASSFAKRPDEYQQPRNNM
jgi:hypothetical protein